MSSATSRRGSVLGSVREVELWCSGVFFPSVMSEEQKARACVHLSRQQMLWVLERSSIDSFGERKCTFSFAQPEVQRISVICAFLEVAHLHWTPCLAYEILLMLSPEQGAGGQWCCCGCFWTNFGWAMHWKQEPGQVGPIHLFPGGTRAVFWLLELHSPGGAGGGSVVTSRTQSSQREAKGSCCQ